MFRIEANLPDECGFEYRQSGTLKLLTDALPAEFSAEEIKDQIHLKQTGPMDRKEKVFVMFSALLSTPFVALLGGISSSDTYDAVIPYRVSMNLTFNKETTCVISERMGLPQFAEPKVSISGDGVQINSLSIEPAPWLFEEAFYGCACEVMCAAIWLTFLLGALIFASLANGLLVPIVISAIILTAVWCVCLFVLRAKRKECEDIKQRFQDWVTSAQ